MQSSEDNLNEEFTIIDVYLGQENYSYDEEEEDLEQQNNEPYVIADIYLNSSPYMKEKTLPNEAAFSSKSTQVSEVSLLYKRLTEEGDHCNGYDSNKRIKLEPVSTSRRQNPYVITYKCIVCSLVFTDFTTYQVHLNEHSHLHSFTCSDCPQRFCNKPQLLDHVREAHRSKLKLKSKPQYFLNLNS